MQTDEPWFVMLVDIEFDHYHLVKPADPEALHTLVARLAGASSGNGTVAH